MGVLMKNKLQNKIDELIKLEELHNIKEQYRQHEKTKSLYEQIDFKPLPQDIMDQCNNEWEINDQLKFLLLSHGFIFNDSINNNNMNKQLQKPDLSIRELTKILFNTLRDENKLAIKIIVREYQEKQLNQREL